LSPVVVGAASFDAGLSYEQAVYEDGFPYYRARRRGAPEDDAERAAAADSRLCPSDAAPFAVVFAEGEGGGSADVTESLLI
jgi:hypothetical protein